MLLRNWGMFTYQVSYVMKDHIRDNMGESTGNMYDLPVNKEMKIIAPNEEVARAWVNARENTNWKQAFEMSLTSEEKAPHILLELAY